MVSKTTRITTMRQFFGISLLLLAVVIAGPPAVAVQSGDTRDAVIAELGQPAGRMTSGTLEVLSFARGVVELRDGRVVTSTVVSAEEAAARRLERESRRAALVAAQEAERQQRYEEGSRLKADTLGDPLFHSRSAYAQLQFWRSFQSRYPEVPVEVELADALSRHRDAQGLKQADRQLQALEARVALAEEKAEAAERRAGDAERRLYRRPYTTVYHDRPAAHKSSYPKKACSVFCKSSHAHAPCPHDAGSDEAEPGHSITYTQLPGHRFYMGHTYAYPDFYRGPHFSSRDAD